MCCGEIFFVFNGLIDGLLDAIGTFIFGGEGACLCGNKPVGYTEDLLSVLLMLGFL